MAETQHSRKRHRQPNQQADSQQTDAKAQRQGDGSAPNAPAAVLSKDASTQTSPPPSPRAAVDDEVDLSSLLLQAQPSVDTPSAWLVSLLLNGFTSTTGLASSANALDSVARRPDAATSNAASVSQSSAWQSPSPTSNRSSVLFASPTTTRPASTHPASIGSPAPRQLATPLARTMPSPVPFRITGPHSAVNGTSVHSDTDGLHGSAASTVSMLHLRPSSAVVLPHDSLRPPLVDTTSMSPLASRTTATLPTVLPWMNKRQAGINPLHQSRFG